jgi:class 3 adenylate cyclase
MHSRLLGIRVEQPLTLLRRRESFVLARLTYCPVRAGSRRQITMNDDTMEKLDEPAACHERSDVRSTGVGLVQQETVVLLVDLVESVRLMREHEADTIRRWADFVCIATT